MMFFLTRADAEVAVATMKRLGFSKWDNKARIVSSVRSSLRNHAPLYVCRSNNNFLLFTQPMSQCHNSLSYTTTVTMQLKSPHGTIIIWQSVPTSPNVQMLLYFETKCSMLGWSHSSGLTCFFTFPYYLLLSRHPTKGFPCWAGTIIIWRVYQRPQTY